MLLAVSPAILTSALWTGPHVNPSTNGRHSTTGAPFAPVCWGKGSVTALESSRRPTEPVSTRTPPIVWQVDVPGTQIVTVANSWLSALLVGPAFTTTGSTFGPPDGAGEDDRSHCDDEAICAATIRPRRSVRYTRGPIECRRAARRRAEGPARTRTPKRRDYARRSEPRGSHHRRRARRVPGASCGPLRWRAGTARSTNRATGACREATGRPTRRQTRCRPSRSTRGSSRLSATVVRGIGSCRPG